MALYIHSVEKRSIAKTIAFLYRWIHVPTQKWYIGSRTAAGCNPDDGYICSSKTVAPLILENRSEWIREVLCIGNPKDIITLEAKYLTLLDAKNDEYSFNRHNGDGKFTSAGKKASQYTRNKMSQSRIGLIKSKNHTNAISNSIKDYLKVNPRLGKNAPGFKGYYISPVGEKFLTSKEASLKFGCSPTTIGRWATSNKHGWKFSPKGVI